MQHATKSELIAFESRMKGLFESGDLPFLLHLCGGNEDQLIDIFRNVSPGDWIFSGHRSHYHYLLAGGAPEDLEARIKGGDSMFVFDKERNFLTSSVLAGTCGIAAGVALSLQMEGSPGHVWCFLGDGAEDEGHFYEAAQFVEGNSLPCTFILEDNDRSVDTSRAQRRGAAWQPLVLRCIRRYSYAPTWPHAGTGCAFRVKFRDPRPRASAG